MQHDGYDDDVVARWCGNPEGGLPNMVFQSRCATIYESATITKNKIIFYHS